MLKSVKTIKCPICGCSEIVEESIEVSCFNDPKVKQHCNGTRWEHRKFLCGYKVDYIPNYSREIESKNSECVYNPVVIAKKEKEEQDKERLMAILEDNNISQTLINKIESYCLY